MRVEFKINNEEDLLFHLIGKLLDNPALIPTHEAFECWPTRTSEGNIVVDLTWKGKALGLGMVFDPDELGEVAQACEHQAGLAIPTEEGGREWQETWRRRASQLRALAGFLKGEDDDSKAPDRSVK